MKVEQYIDERLRTENLDEEGMIERYKRLWRIDHMVKGLVTEAGELQDLVKKELNYGSTIGVDRYVDECSDVAWYYYGLLDAMYDQWGVDDYLSVSGITPTRVEWITNLDNLIRERNIAKLRTRYPEKFSLENADNRDLKKEAVVFDLPSVTK